MALDRWLFEQHYLGFHPPTLRFYTWSPVAISLGYHQHRYPEAWRQLQWNGESVELVQRPTGGRAVLHQGDLTYAVVLSGMPDNRIAAYQQICEFLIAGWRSLHIPLHYGDAGRGYIHNPNCFGTATGADLVLPDGTKFIGSAQMRRGKTILQHGSMRLNPDPYLFQQVFGVEMEPVELPLLRGDRTSNEILETIISALTTAAKECFGITLIPANLTDNEWQAIMATTELS
jgi:lipoate---protein ligase